MKNIWVHLDVLGACLKIKPQMDGLVYSGSLHIPSLWKPLALSYPLRTLLVIPDASASALCFLLTVPWI